MVNGSDLPFSDLCSHVGQRPKWGHDGWSFATPATGQRAFDVPEAPAQRAVASSATFTAAPLMSRRGWRRWPSPHQEKVWP
jgi:hypothetical protein